MLKFMNADNCDDYDDYVDDDDHVDDDNDEQVNLTLLVVAEVTPGLPTTCDVQVSVKVAFVNDENDDDDADDDDRGDNPRHQCSAATFHYVSVSKPNPVWFGK